MDFQKAFDDAFEAVKGYVDRSFAAFDKRLSAIEERKPERGEKGDAGERGESGLPGLNGKDGAPGLPGERGPVGKDGVDGQNGRDGSDGADGTSVDSDTIRRFVVDAIGAIPPPADGKNGIDGKNGVDGLTGKDGKDGADGSDGKDGVGLAGASIARDGSLIVTTSDGRIHNLGFVAGKDGEPGRDGQAGIDGKSGRDGADGKNGVNGIDGKDGFGFDDLSVEHDGERKFTFKFTQGDRVKSFPFTLPVVLDSGVFKSDAEYEAGDAVSYGGSYWISQGPIKAAPGLPDSGWRLAVKRGRDGKNGVDGERGLQGKEGPAGRDLTQMSLDGSKH